MSTVRLGFGINISRIHVDYAYNSWSTTGGLHQITLRFGMEDLSLRALNAERSTPRPEQVLEFEEGRSRCGVQHRRVRRVQVAWDRVVVSAPGVEHGERVELIRDQRFHYHRAAEVVVLRHGAGGEGARHLHAGARSSDRSSAQTCTTRAQSDEAERAKQVAGDMATGKGTNGSYTVPTRRTA